MWVGIGVGIGRNRFATGIFNAYALRVTADGGITEAGQCVDAVSGLLLNASLLLIPSGYKGGKLYSEIPTNGNGDLTWTRGSDGFRTNASGLIQRVPWNLLQYSDAFDNAAWVKSFASITANATTAPDGTNSADKIIGVGVNPLIYQSTSTLTGKCTFSIYGKKGELSWLRLTNSSAGTNAVWFDLNNRAVGTIVGAGNSANITSAGNGWYRCEFIINSFDSSQLTDLVIACTNADNTTTGYTGNSVDGLFIWGAQLVEGTTAQTYLPTTDRLNFPRLSYMYGSCPAVLLEPQRTNSFTQSQSFADYYINRTTATDLGTPSIFSSGSIARFTATAFDSRFGKIIGSITSGSTYTVSGFFDLSEGIYAGISDSSANYRIFNLLTASVVGSGNGTLTISCKSTQIGSSNYYRIAFTFTATTTGNHFFVIGKSDGTLNTTNETVAAGYFQREDSASYPTTYIPTTSATATRVADSFSRNNIYTNGLISASGGTWFVELRGNVGYTRDASIPPLFISNNSVGDGAGADVLAIGNVGFANSRIYIFKRINGIYTQLAATTTDTVKIAIKWNGSTADVFINGTKQVSATTFTRTSMEFLNCSGGDVPKFIQQMALFPEPKSDQFCTDITTL